MTTTVLRNLSYVATFDQRGRELIDTDIVVSEGRIVGIGTAVEVPADAQIIDGHGWLALPGLTNAHQHLYQIGMRALPELERAAIGRWLSGLGSRCLCWWRNGVLTPETVGALAAAGMVESLLTGVTTVADQHYFFPGPGPTIPYIEATIESARETASASTPVGARSPSADATEARRTTSSHNASTRCSDMQRSSSPPTTTLPRSPRSASTWHRAGCTSTGLSCSATSPRSLRRGPRSDCTRISTRSSTPASPRHGTGARRGSSSSTTAGPSPTPGSHTWSIRLATRSTSLPRQGWGIAHLIAPDLRMGWGLAPLREYLDAGCRVGFGTTGSASNDGANVLGDLRLAALAHRSVHADPQRWPTVRELLRMATRESASIVGRPDLGRLEAGCGADIACWDMTTVERAVASRARRLMKQPFIAP